MSTQIRTSKNQHLKDGQRKRTQEIKDIVIPSKPRTEDGSRNREHSGVSSDVYHSTKVKIKHSPLH